MPHLLPLVGSDAAVVAERDVRDFGQFERRLLRQTAQRLLMLLHGGTKLAALHLRSAGRPDLISSFSVVFVGVLGAWGFLASHCCTGRNGSKSASHLHGVDLGLDPERKTPRCGRRFWL